MVLTLLVALAPALATSLVMLLVEGPAVWRLAKAAVSRKASALREDKPTLEVAAEALVHLSTYGSVVLAYVLDKAFGVHLGHLAIAGVSLLWFLLTLRLARAVRAVLHDLES